MLVESDSIVSKSRKGRKVNQCLMRSRLMLEDGLNQKEFNYINRVANATQIKNKQSPMSPEY